MVSCVSLRKLARSTLVLVLVFGVHYIVFVGMPHAAKGVAWEVRMYCELFFNSFQVLVLLVIAASIIRPCEILHSSHLVAFCQNNRKTSEVTHNIMTLHYCNINIIHE